MRNLLFSLPFLVVLAMPTSLFAATLSGGESYTLSPDERITDDLYAAGGTVVFSGTGTQDVALFGGKLVVPGTIGGDLFAAGGDIDVLGTVGDDLRVMGGSVFLSGAVAGDLVVLGGSINVLPGATVGGDLIVFGGEVVIEGVVKGDATLYAGKVRVRGETGPLTVRSGDITLKDATVHGDFSYTSSNEASIDASSRIEGATHRTAIPSRERELAGIAAVLGGAFFLGKLAALLLATLVLFYLFPVFSVRYGTSAVEKFGRSVFVGLGALVAIPVLSVLLLLTLIGAYLGVVGLVAYVLLLIVAELFSGMVAGAVLSRVFVREARVTLPWLLGGVIFMEFVFLAPFIGWAIAFIIYTMSFGTLARFLYGGWRSRDSFEHEE